MKSVKEVNELYKKGLTGLYHPDEINAICRLTLTEVSGFSAAKLKAFPETEISAEWLVQLNQILAKLKTGKPVQYILGETEFYGLPFKVSPAVLIPRPETEELVRWIITTEKEGSKKTGTILDIGTGSGCIAISLKTYLFDYQISAIDISSDALNIAKGNARLSNANINWIEADILNIDMERLPQFDTIVSNPPYVTEADKNLMHKNVTDFEPHLALFVPENDPLIFYKAIAGFAESHLKSQGLLYFEINEAYGRQIVDLLANYGFNDVELRQDLSGKDRMARGRLTPRVK